MSLQSGVRVAIVTGGAYGIGRGIVEHFAAHNIAVAIADLNQERGQRLAEQIAGGGGQAQFVPTDIRDETAVRNLVEHTLARWGQLDILCNNAGIERYRLAADYTTEDWNAIVHTNLRGPFLCAKYAMPHLRRQKGAVVNIASVQAIACERQISIYAATKAGLLALTRGMALDYARDGVRVNAICPGAIRTGMWEAAMANETDPAAVTAAVSAAIPLGRVGEPADIAPLAYFLASSEAAYITGATFVVDGGLLAKLAL